MTRWIHPPEIERQRLADPFDPIVEGDRHGLPRARAIALWDRVCADATDGAGRRDLAGARRRFHELAPGLAADGPRRPEVGKATRVGVELDGVPPPAIAGVHERAIPTPGRATQVAVAARQRAPGPDEAGGPDELDGHRGHDGFDGHRGHDGFDGHPRAGIDDVARGGPVRRTLATTFGGQARGIDIVMGAGAAGARGLTRDGRVHLGRSSLDWSRFEDRFLLGHEIAHAIQQRHGAGLAGETTARGRRAAFEDEADRAGLSLARGLPFQVTERAPARMSLFRDPRKVVKMTLISERGLMILELDDGTRESVKLRYNGRLRPGEYVYDPDKGQLTTDAGATPDRNGNIFRFWTPIDASYATVGLVPLRVVSGVGAGHRIQAQPELADAMPGTKVGYYVATDPELGGKYEYRWWCENDPVEAKARGKALLVTGPTTSKWDATWAFPGRHIVVCEVTDLNTRTKERLEFYQRIRAEAAISDEAFGNATAPDYARFRAGLELKNLDNIQGGLADQSGNGTPPFIRCAGQNPAVPGRAPDLAYNTYTITPSPGAKKFRWTARPQTWDLLPTQGYFGFTKITAGGVASYDLASDGPTARFIIADAQVWTIVCEELDGSGQPIGTKVTYRQVIQTQAQAEAAAKWRAYMKRTDDAMGKIAEHKDVGVRASYVNRETGETLPLQLFVGPSAADPGKMVLLDLLPGVDKVEYTGSSIDGALSDFDTNNSYPKGTIKLEVPANEAGVPARSRTFDTKGESDWALWSSRVGWASLGLTVAGVIAAVIPGGQPVAAVLFIAAAATGATASSLSLYDRLQKAEKSPTGIALDIAGIAGSLIGAAGAIRALRAGSQAVALAGTAGKFLLYSGFVTNAVSGLLISVEGIDQIVKVLDSPMSRGDKISALVRVLGMLIVQGVLFALSVRELKQMRGRLGGFLGEELTGKLPTDVLHSLNLLDDQALKALGKTAGLTAAELTQIAKVARVDPRLANRLASLEGLAIGSHDVNVAGGVIALDGQIKLDPGKLAAMTDDELRNLMKACKSLKTAGGDLSQLSTAERKLVEDLSKSGGQRLRFDAQLKQVDQFVAEVAADARGKQLFNDISDGERRRMYDLVNAKRPGTGNLDRQASDFALGRARSVSEYVELFESYVTKYKQVIAEQTEAHQTAVAKEVERRIAAAPAMSAGDKARLPKVVQKELATTAFGAEIEGFGDQFKKAMAAKVENDLGVVGDPTKAGTGATRTQATFDANKAALAGHIGTDRIASGLSDADAIARVKAVPEVKFASETAGSYHVEKHGVVGKELPPSELAGDKVAGFLASANKTVREGAAVVKVNQDGSRTLIFTRVTPKEDGLVYTLTAMVNVSDDGKVLLATYMGSKK
jgi:putative RNase toxin 3 of polymorphic toxin system/uncharacterized protein DUF4157